MTPISPFSDWPHPRRHSVTQLGTSLNLGYVCGDSRQWQTSPIETQYQLGMSLNHGHIHDSHQSIQWQTSPMETQYQLCMSLNQGRLHNDSHQSIQWQTSPMETQCSSGTTVNQGHVCDDWYNDRPNQWKHTVSVRCITEPKSYTWYISPYSDQPHQWKQC